MQVSSRQNSWGFIFLQSKIFSNFLINDNLNPLLVSGVVYLSNAFNFLLRQNLNQIYSLNPRLFSKSSIKSIFKYSRRDMQFNAIRIWKWSTPAFSSGPYVRGIICNSVPHFECEFLNFQNYIYYTELKIFALYREFSTKNYIQNVEHCCKLYSEYMEQKKNGQCPGY